MPTIISSETAKLKYPRVSGMKTPGGSPIRDNGDRVAVALRGTSTEDHFAIAERNGFRSNLDALKAAGKNVGQIRMTLGRMLRARVANHEADPEKNAMPYLPEPKHAATPKPGEATEVEDDEADDEVAEDEDDEGEAEESVSAR